MKISFDLDKEDIMAFNRYYYDTDHAVRKVRRYALWIGPVMFVIAAVALSYSVDWDWLPFALFGVAIVLWLILWPGFSRKKWAKKTMKTICSPENALWFGKREMDFGDEKVAVVTDKSESTVLWSGFIKSVETPGYFFLFQTNVQALVVPKQKITQDQAGELRSLLAKHIAVNTSEIKNKK